MQGTISTITGQKEKQNGIHFALGFHGMIIVLFGRQCGTVSRPQILCLVQIQGKQRVGEDGDCIGMFVNANQSTGGKAKISLVADHEEIVNLLKGFAMDIFQNFVVVLFFVFVQQAFQGPFRALDGKQGKCEESIQGVHGESRVYECFFRKISSHAAIVVAVDDDE